MPKHGPNDSDLVPMDERDWRFEPAELPDFAMDMFHDAIDVGFSDFGGLRQDEKAISAAEVTLRWLLGEHPNFIDGHHHLALLLNETGRTEEARLHWERAVNIGMQEFIGNLSASGNSLRWGWLGNRPFLRAYHSTGLQCMREGNFFRAIAIFDTMLRINPDDNQGARLILVECYFEIDRPADVLRVCMKYSDDCCSENLLYGKVLALFKLGKRERAEKALAQAERCLPKVAAELVKRSHKRPQRMWKNSICVGGDDQAFSYWERQGKVWKRTPGAIDMVKDFLAKKSVSGGIHV